MTAWLFLTRWGNSLLLLPTAAAIAVCLYGGGERGVAWRWAACLGAALALVLATKVAFLGWGWGGGAFDFTGISGHSTLAAAVLPMLAWWLTKERSRKLRLRVVAGAAIFAIAVGLSRIALSAHSGSEVVSGLLLGFGVAWLTIPSATTSAAQLGRLRWLVLLALLAVGGMTRVGDSDGAHGLVLRLALALSGRDEPFQRHAT